MGSPYGVKGFPTLKFFGGDKAKPTDYNGQRTADGLISFSIGEAQKLAKSRLSGGGKSSSGNKQKTEQKKKEGENTKTKTGGSDVMELDSSNFDTTLVDSTDMWMIVFYAPWCGHCKRLHPEWDKAAAALKGVAKFGKVDADADKELNNRYGIRGFPTIKVFMPGGDLDKPITYEEGRDEPAFIAYVNKMMDGKIPNPLTQLITSKIFNDKCMKDSKLCLLIFLPHMIDSTVEGRNAYLKIVEDIAVKHRSRPINYFWLQAGDQSALEQSFNLGFGFPAVVAYSPNKKVYSTLKAAFSKEGLVQFVESMFIRKANVLKIENIGEIVDSLAWDGKQYTPPPEDDDDVIFIVYIYIYII